MLTHKHTHTHTNHSKYLVLRARELLALVPLSALSLSPQQVKSRRDELQDVVVKARCAPLFAVVCVSCGSSEVKENGKLQKASKLFAKKKCINNKYIVFCITINATIDQLRSQMTTANVRMPVCVCVCLHLFRDVQFGILWPSE